MRPIIIFLLFGTVYLHAAAQDGSVYLKGGLNLANVSTTDDGHIDKAHNLASFHIGLIGSIPLGEVVALQPGVLFTGKGTKSQSGQPGDTYYYKATSNPFYIEVPLNLVFKLPLSPGNSSIFFGAGPYAAIGIAGKNKTEGNAGPVAFKKNDAIQFSNDDPSTFNEQEGAGLGIMRRFDFGLNAVAGLELDKVLLSVNYGYGLTKINSVANDDDDKNKHRVLGFSIGFKL